MYVLTINTIFTFYFSMVQNGFLVPFLTDTDF